MSTLKIYEDSKNYTAQVIKLPPKQTVPGLDNLVEVNVFGNSCLVGKDSPENELYLFFPAGAQLSEAFCIANNLFREQQLNSDPNQKGFFEVNRRVKAIKFRGIISTGFVIPVLSLPDDIHIAKGIGTILSPGDSFNEIEGYEVCRKYFVPGPTQGTPKGDKQAKINNRLTNLLIPNQFRFHVETSHLANNLHRLNPDDIIVLTDKWHGSSCILAKVLIAKKLTLWQKLLNKVGGKVPDREYGYIYSSGKPKSNLPKGIEESYNLFFNNSEALKKWENDNKDYYTSNIWKRAYDDHKHTLEDGISLYGELVGYTEGGQFIQKGYDYGCIPFASKIGKGIGSTVEYTINNEKYNAIIPPEYRFVIYRITYTKPNGEVIEFSWQQIKDYCAKYNLETVKELYFGTMGNFVPEYACEITEMNNINDYFFYKLQNAFNLEGMCRECTNKVPAEGITLRIDGKPQFLTFKLKSKLFLKKESDDLDKGETNIEDNA